ncbi:MAG TPA: hypothetical protein VK923_20950 [Euzebyales bacterium]|nr:hypothetical protein [Euzebyales bacterium]
MGLIDDSHLFDALPAGTTLGLGRAQAAGNLVASSSNHETRIRCRA